MRGNKKSSAKKNKDFAVLISIYGLTVLSELISLFFLAGRVFVKGNPYKNDVFDARTLTLKEEEIESIQDTLKQFGVEVFDEGDEADYILLNAIYENENLLEVDKKYLMRFYQMLVDNPYLDREYVYSMLSKLKIEYMNRPADVWEKVTGRFFKEKATAEIYDSLESTKAHEVTHAIYSKNYEKLPQFFNEAVTTLQASEYDYGTSDFWDYSYTFGAPFVKVLCEMVGADTVLKTYTLGDMDILYQEMANLYGSPMEAAQFLDFFERIYTTYIDTQDAVSMEAEKKDMENLYANYAKAVLKRDEIKNTCNAVFMDYNWNLFHFIFKDVESDSCYEPTPVEKYIKYIHEYGIARKAYFSSALKETCVPCFDMDFNKEMVRPNRIFGQKLYLKKRS